jgi:hypothetical protein
MFPHLQSNFSRQFFFVGILEKGNLSEKKNLAGKKTTLQKV